MRFHQDSGFALAFASIHTTLVPKLRPFRGSPRPSLRARCWLLTAPRPHVRGTGVIVTIIISLTIVIVIIIITITIIIIIIIIVVLNVSNNHISIIIIIVIIITNIILLPRPAKVPGGAAGGRPTLRGAAAALPAGPEALLFPAPAPWQTGTPDPVRGSPLRRVRRVFAQGCSFSAVRLAASSAHPRSESYTVRYLSDGVKTRSAKANLITRLQQVLRLSIS